MAAVFTGAEAALPLFTEHPPLPRRIFAVLIFFIVALALVSRIVLQQHPPEFEEHHVPTSEQIDAIIHARVTAALQAAH